MKEKIFDEQIENQILEFIRSEKKRVMFGALFIEIKMTNGQMVNISCETKNSKNINLGDGSWKGL